MSQNTIAKDRLIIGLTGSLGSGISTSAKYLVKILGSKVYKVTGEGWDSEEPKEIQDRVYKFSGLIEEEAEKRGEKRNSKGEFNRELLQKIGNEIRRDKGPGYLAAEILNRISRIEEKIGGKRDYAIVIDGIKNSGEVAELRKYSNFFLFAIDAFLNKRWGRKKLDYNGNEIEFEEDDKRDHNENIDYGQQVDKCVYLSDILINNDSDNKNELYHKILTYLVLIKKKNYSYPLPCETIMTQAYCESLKSSCIKRKVGAIIVNNGKPIAYGYNDVPPNEIPCEDKLKMCKRDEEKINLIKELKKCPYCGMEVEQTIECPGCHSFIKINDLTPKCQNPECNLDLDIDTFFICRHCRVKIIEKFIGKKSELCRAVHAEENAILQLSTLGISLNNMNATLYTTTFPCLQCANKIIAAGIKAVVYVEPYPIKDAWDLLVNSLGQKKVEKFQGIKARAYFRVYDKTEWIIKRNKTEGL